MGKFFSIAAIALALLWLGPNAMARDLADDEYAELLSRIYAGHPRAAAAYLDSLSTECTGEPFFLIAQSRLLLEAVPEDDLDKSRAKILTQPVLATLQQAVNICDERLAAGDDQEKYRRLRGWAWMVRSQAHAQGRSFYSAGREAGRGKSDLEFFLATHPEDPAANGLLGAFLYFSDAVPAVLQLVSKLMFLPTGDRALGLEMIQLAEAGPSAKQEDFRTLAMTVNLIFEGRWENGLPQAISLQENHPAYARLALPLSAMRLFAPGLGAELEARMDMTEAISARRPQADVDITSLWMNRTYRAWIDRLLLGPAAAEPRFAAIDAAAPEEPDWVAQFAADQLEELAADRSDKVPDELIMAVWSGPEESVAGTTAELESLATVSLRAAFFAGEGHLRQGNWNAAEQLYRKVEAWKGPDHLEPFRMIAATRVGELKARVERFRSASRWYTRATKHHRNVYRMDWILQGRARHFEERGQDGTGLPSSPILFSGSEFFRQE